MAVGGARISCVAKEHVMTAGGWLPSLPQHQKWNVHWYPMQDQALILVHLFEASIDEQF